MKRLAILLAGLLLSLGFVRAQETNLPRTGAGIGTYNLTGVAGTYRNLTERATTLTTLPDTLNHKYVLSFDKDTLVPVPVYTGLGRWSTEKRKACVELPKEMMFGRQAVRNVGITTDGFLFFGDSVVPSFVEGDNSITFYMLQQKGSNFVYFSLVDLLRNGKVSRAAIMRSGADTKIGYEIVGDTLFIGYENIIVRESATDSQVLSWNYRINTATGAISLQTKGFYSGVGSYPDRKFAYGMVGSRQNDDIWLSEFFTPKSISKGSVVFCSIQKDSLPDGRVMTFNAPEPCQHVENPIINWNYSSTENTISLAGTTWEGTNKVLFVFSKTEEASANSLPEDGKDYSNINEYISSTVVGTDSAAAIVAELRSGSVRGLASVFSGLTKETDYWIHGYLYNTTCANGPLYSAPRVQKIRTSIAAPEQNKISLDEFTKNSMKLVLGEPETAGRKYVVAVSESPLGRYGNITYNLLQNGKTYNEGDKVASAIVKFSNVPAGTYTIDNLTEGKVYRVYVWLSNGEAESDYSAAYVEVLGQTSIEAPVTVDFNGYAVGDTPALWVFDGFNNNTGAPYMVVEYSSGGGGPLSAKAPENGTKVLYTTMYYSGEASLPQRIHTSAVSPIIFKGESENIAAIFNLGFYTTGNGLTACKIKAEDSIVISWAESQDAQTWNRLGAITSTTQLDASGFVTFSLPAFIPSGNEFCFKIETYLAVKSADDGLGVAIESIVLEEDRPCKYPIDIAVVKESITTSSAIVKWTDANPDLAQQFIVTYRAEGDEEWLCDSVNSEEITLTNLSTSTLYTVNIQAVCGAEKGVSMRRTTSFTTMLGLPYSYIPNETGAFPEDCSQYRGLPGSNLTAIDMKGEDPKWTVSDDALENEKVLVNRLQQNPNAWFVFPVVNSPNKGTVRIKINLSAWGFYLMEGNDPKEALKTHDSLWVFVSETGDFKTDRQLLGYVNIDSLHYKTIIENEEKKVVYDSAFFEFDVESKKSYTLALYVPAKTAADMGFDVDAILAISSVEMDYARIVYPAVTDLHTENLTKESVTIAWKGEADEYKLLYKERAAEGEYTEVETDQLSYNLTGLKPKTQYAYYVYGIYGGEKGEESEVQYFRTLTDVLDTVKTPVFSITPGEVEKGTEVAISCGTDNATIYYTTDGTNPTTGSTVYKTPIIVDSTVTIKAFAAKSDMISSDMIEGTYTVKVANESDLLAEVKLYPNPTDGLFYVTVPEAAKVEIYTTNGTLVKQLHVAAGQTTLQLNQAGMYFVKVSINGQFAIRKIVVR